MKKTSCQAIAKKTNQQCGKTSLSGVAYCWLHYPKKQTIEFFILGILLTFLFQTVFNLVTVSPEEQKINQLQEQVKELSAQNQELIDGKNTLIAKLDKYQKDLNEKEQKVKELRSEVKKLSSVAPKLKPDGRIAASPYVSYASEFSDGISKARALFNDGKFQEAYQIAKSLSDKNPEFGLSYFIMGTIEIQQGNYAFGEKLLEKAIQLELLTSDKAWAYHNLGISAMRQNKIHEAITFLNKAVETDSNMNESKILLENLKRKIVN